MRSKGFVGPENTNKKTYSLLLLFLLFLCFLRLEVIILNSPARFLDLVNVLLNFIALVIIKLLLVVPVIKLSTTRAMCENAC